MSKTELDRFVRDMQTNAALRDAVRNKGGAVDDIVEIAKAHGYDITAEEARAAIAAKGPELTEEHLRNVAAGRAVETTRGDLNI